MNRFSPEQKNGQHMPVSGRSAFIKSLFTGIPAAAENRSQGQA
jgi:hypothetical protein